MPLFQILVVGPDGKDQQEITISSNLESVAVARAEQWCREETSGWTVLGVVQ